MDPVVFWFVVYILKDHLDRVTRATEVLTASVNRVEGRLIEVQDNLRLLRGVTEPIEEMDVD